MARRHYKLPSLNTLAAFETSARNGSFKNAARELGVTPGAVSHQIKSLEEDLDVVLFIRQHRGVEITREGKKLFAVLQQSFLDISSALNDIRNIDQKPVVTISATTAFSSLWLTPRLTQFWKTCGDISVNQHVSDTPNPFDETPDLRIVYGFRQKNNPRLTAEVLFRDELIPVCSPTFLAEHKDNSLKALASLPLIHLTAPDDRWTTWHSWFEYMGYNDKISHTIEVNNHMIALQTASEDAGVVLGWKNLLEPMLSSGALVPFSDHCMPAPSDFYLVSEREDKLDENVRHVRECLLKSDADK